MTDDKLPQWVDHTIRALCCLVIVAYVFIFFALGVELLRRAIGQTAATDFFSTSIGLVLSGFIGLATALYIERCKVPRLEINIAPESDQHIGTREARFLHLAVSHLGVSRVLGRLLMPSPALACVAKLRFLGEDGQDIMPVPFDARWTGSQQPSEFISESGQLFPSVFEILRRRDIYPRAEEKIDVCVKFDDEDECFVFTNSSYTSGFSASDRRIKSGIYLVEATVSCGDITISRRFRLRNDFRRADFRLDNC